MHVSKENIYIKTMHKKLDMVMAVYNLLVSDARSHERIFFICFLIFSMAPSINI